MKNLEQVEGVLTVGFNDEFPEIGQVRNLVDNDGEKVKAIIIGLENYRWKKENGVVVGTLVNVKCVITEVTRPSSKGKFRLVECSDI